MKDFRGNELKVQDEVVFVLKNGDSICLAEGRIREMKHGCAYIDITSGIHAGWSPRHGVRGQNIMKKETNP